MDIDHCCRGGCRRPHLCNYRATYHIGVVQFLGWRIAKSVGYQAKRRANERRHRSAKEVAKNKKRRMRNKEKIVALLNEIEELSETLSKQDTTPTKRLFVGHDLDNCLLLLARYSIRDIADQCGVTLAHTTDDEVDGI